MGSKGILGPLLRAVMPGKRPSDNVKLAVDFPQEEEFALGGANPHSYYRCLYFPNHYKRHYAVSMDHYILVLRCLPVGPLGNNRQNCELYFIYICSYNYTNHL
jgi:hypothetical protein